MGKLLLLPATGGRQHLTFLPHLSLMLLYLIADEARGGNAKKAAARRKERVPKSDPHGERAVDTDGPKQRAE